MIEVIIGVALAGAWIGYSYLVRRQTRKRQDEFAAHIEKVIDTIIAKHTAGGKLDSVEEFVAEVIDKTTEKGSVETRRG